MSPVYLNPPPSSPIPFLELKGDQNALHMLDQRHDHFNTTTSDGTLALEYTRHPQEIKVENSNDIGQVFQSSSWAQNFQDGGGCSYGYATNHKNQTKIETNTSTSNDQKFSKKWKPSKVRIMQKMMNTSKNNMGEQHKLHLERQQSNIHNTNNTNNNGIRVCTDCHTTTTPLWRSGPRGPKSLCNACGIRQRKARRAAMAAAGFAKEEGVGPMSIDSPKVKASQDQEMMGESSGFISHPLPLKKRGKIVKPTTSTRNYNNTDNNSNNDNSDNRHQNNRLMSSSNKDYMMGTSQRGFPRDEEEGAILLMALSCGLAFSL